MICTIVKGQIDCMFFTRQGVCTYRGGHCEQVVEACEGCDNIVAVDEDYYCKTSASPSAKWNFGTCNYASHLIDETPKVETKKVNPLKASKRAAAGKK